MRKIHALGINDFGENRAQDLLAKKSELCDLNVKWHFIGHLQTNKVKQMINEIDVLHTLDRLSLALMIQKYRMTPLDCFIQVNMTDESQKSGLFPDNLPEFLKEIKKCDKINIIGLMTIGMQNNMDLTTKAFQNLKMLAKENQLPFLSMGMSEDYQIAIKEGATHLRIGSLFKAYM
jgi:PLP dependent protein